MAEINCGSILTKRTRLKYVLDQQLKLIQGCLIRCRITRKLTRTNFETSLCVKSAELQSILPPENHQNQKSFVFFNMETGRIVLKNTEIEYAVTEHSEFEDCIPQLRCVLTLRPSLCQSLLSGSLLMLENHIPADLLLFISMKHQTIYIYILTSSIIALIHQYKLIALAKREKEKKKIINL